MQYFTLEPEVAGNLGEQSVVDTSVHPPVVTSLDYQFDGWLGDELLESFPCFLVTVPVGVALEAAALTGFTLAECTVSRSEQFEELHPGTALPEFRWLQVTGEAGVEDVGMSTDHCLVVSARAHEVLSGFRLEACDVEPWPG